MLPWAPEELGLQMFEFHGTHVTITGQATFKNIKLLCKV